MNQSFDGNSWEKLRDVITSCRKCPRLVEWRERVALEKRKSYREWEYWGKPVPGFGDPQGRVLIVGLAPAAHGANRTGRNFTGDSSGDFLYRALHKAGFANQPVSIRRGDGLELKDIYIAAVCRCAPPDNKPLPDELENCRPYLVREISMMQNLRGMVALGRIAFDSILRIFRHAGNEVPRFTFQHTGFYQPGPGLPWLVSSYHPSRQNTQTGRLTEAMFDEVWEFVRLKLKEEK
ncbi:MAG: uracil-DNA glycosylase [Chloroflexi bacterium]|nr:MAG: uracil-DNA glycosylase [Chloroflexota bacterium]